MPNFSNSDLRGDGWRMHSRSILFRVLIALSPFFVWRTATASDIRQITVLNRLIGFNFNGGGSALSGTTVSCQRVAYTGTIVGWYIDADVAGSATFGVRSVAFGSYTGVAGYSGYTDVTGGGTAPVLSSAAEATFSNLTSWVTSVSAGTEVCAQLSSPATAAWVNLYLVTSGVN